MKVEPLPARESLIAIEDLKSGETFKFIDSTTERYIMLSSIDPHGCLEIVHLQTGDKYFCHKTDEVIPVPMKAVEYVEEEGTSSPNGV